MKHTEYIVPIGEDAQDYDEMFIGVIRRQPELVRCKDPAPPTHANAKKPKVQQKPAPEKKSLLAEWVLKNLCDPYMNHITAVPEEDIQRLKGISNYETYMTAKVRERMHRNDVRVMVREVELEYAAHCKGYNARLIFE